MSPEEKEKLELFKRFTVKGGVPEDLTKAIQTFIQQAIIIGEYELDAMPPEYMENLLDAMSKYPEYNKVTLVLQFQTLIAQKISSNKIKFPNTPSPH